MEGDKQGATSVWDTTISDTELADALAQFDGMASPAPSARATLNSKRSREKSTDSESSDMSVESAGPSSPKKTGEVSMPEANVPFLIYSIRGTERKDIEIFYEEESMDNSMYGDNLKKIGETALFTRMIGSEESSYAGPLHHMFKKKTIGWFLCRLRCSQCDKELLCCECDDLKERVKNLFIEADATDCDSDEDKEEPIAEAILQKGKSAKTPPCEVILDTFRALQIYTDNDIQYHVSTGKTLPDLITKYATNWDKYSRQCLAIMRASTQTRDFGERLDDAFIDASVDERVISSTTMVFVQLLSSTAVQCKMTWRQLVCRMISILKGEDTKKKGIILVGASDGGKSALVRLFTSLYKEWEVGHFKTTDKSATFIYDDLPGTSIYVGEEITLNEVSVESFKTLLEGSQYCTADIKYKSKQTVPPRPVLVTSQMSPTLHVSSHTQAVKNRALQLSYFIHQYECECKQNTTSTSGECQVCKYECEWQVCKISCDCHSSMSAQACSSPACNKRLTSDDLAGNREEGRPLTSQAYCQVFGNLNYKAVLW